MIGKALHRVRSLRVWVRLAWTLGLLLALILAVALVAAQRIYLVNETVVHYTTQTTPTLQAVKGWQEKLATIRMLQAQHLMTASDAEMDVLEKTIAETQASLRTSLSRSEGSSAAQDQAIHRDFTDTVNLSLDYWDRLRKLSRQSLAEPDKTEEVRRLFTGRSQRLFTSSAAAIERQWQATVDAANALAMEGRSNYLSSMTLLAASCAVSLVLGAGAALLVIRSITLQLGGEPRDAARIAMTISEGDLSEPPSSLRASVRGSVMAAMDDMRSRLSDLVSAVRDSSESIAAGASQLMTGNFDLSERTALQAGQLQQTASAMSTLTDSVRESSAKAQRANQLASAASRVAVQGGEAVERVVTTMEDISHSSKTISEITAVINGIAFQTNILALNAGVEAARAGEQGRGFAVVAAEVRLLSNRSADAARDIKELIDRNVGKVAQGRKQVQEAGVSVRSIVSQVQEVGQMIDAIHETTVHQYDGLLQVSATVDSLDQTTMQNAALAEQGAAATQNLQRQASRLTELVSVFRLSSVGQDHPPKLASGAMPSAPHPQ